MKPGLRIALHGRESDALELVPFAKTFAAGVRSRMEQRGLMNHVEKVLLPGGASVVAHCTAMTSDVHVVPAPVIVAAVEDESEVKYPEWVTILGESFPVGGFGAFAGVAGLAIPQWRVGVVKVPYEFGTSEVINAMSVRLFTKGDLNGGTWFRGDYIYAWLRDIINYTRYDNLEWVGLEVYEDGFVSEVMTISEAHITPTKIHDTTRIASMLNTQFPNGSGAFGYTMSKHVEAVATLGMDQDSGAYILAYASESGAFCPIQSECFYLREDGTFDYSLPGGDYQDATVPRLTGAGTVGSALFDPLVSCKRMFGTYTPVWATGSVALADSSSINPDDYRRYGILCDADFAAGLNVPVHDFYACDERMIWNHTYTCNGRMIGGLFGSVIDMGVYETEAGDPTVYVHSTLANVVVEVRQILDDGTLESVSFYVYEDEHLDNDTDGRAVREVGTTGSTHYYVTRNVELVLAPLNTILAVEDRAYSTRYFGEDLDEKRGLYVKAGWSKIGGVWRNLTIADGSMGHVVRWAKDGSAYLTRRWSKEILCYEYTPADIYNQPDILTYDLMTIVESYDGWTLQPAMTIKNKSYGSITQPITSARLSIYHSRNMKIVAVMGSLDTDGIWVRDSIGVYSRLDDPDTSLPFEIIGREPVYISDDERCIATKTSIWVDGVLVCRPTHCCGVFFNRTHYVDKISDNQFAIRILDEAGGIVDTTPAGQYNFWEMSDDSSMSMFSRFYIDDDNEAANDSPEPAGVVLIVDFADESYKFEHTDRSVQYRFVAGELSEYGKFYSYYTADNLDGIPYGRRTAEYYVIGTESFYTYCEPTWGVCGNDFIEYGSHRELHMFPAWNGSDYVVGPLAGEHTRIRALYATVSVCYPDADSRRQSGSFDGKRIIKHVYHHKIGILERTKDGIGPF